MCAVFVISGLAGVASSHETCTQTEVQLDLTWRGQVLDVLGMPIGGATVVGKAGPQTTSVTTAGDGRWAMTLRASCPTTFTASDSRYVSASKHFDDPLIEHAQPVNFTLPFRLVTSVTPGAFRTTPQQLSFVTDTTAPSSLTRVPVQLPDGTLLEMAQAQGAPAGWQRWTLTWTFSGSSDGSFDYRSCALASATTLDCDAGLGASQRLSEIATGRYILDRVAPTVSAWSPAPFANTLWKRPAVAATLTDDRSGIDAGSIAFRLNGAALTASYSPATGMVSAGASSDLALDSNHTLAVRFADLAGNTAEPSSIFRVVKIEQGSTTAEIADVAAQVPSALACPQNCTVTFDDVAVTIGKRTVRISSSLHGGTATLNRSLSLATAEVIFQTATGPRSYPANLGPAAKTDRMLLDGPYELGFGGAFEQEPHQLGDITRPVPVGVLPGSTAVLRMSPANQSPPCADSSAVPDPAICGGPTLPGVDPVGPGEPVALAAASQLSDADYSSLVAGEDAAPLAVSFPLPEHDAENYVPPPPSGSTNVPTYLGGVVAIKVKVGEDVSAVVASHGDGPYVHVATPPFDPDEIANGLDRNYHVTVPGGQEPAKVQAYAADSRVEYAHLVGDGPGELHDQSPQLLPDDYNRRDAWHLKETPGEWGTVMNHAWPFANFPWHAPGSSPLNGYHGTQRVKQAVIDTGILGTHADLLGKVDAGYSFAPPGGPIPAGANSESGCRDSHGTGTAGVNAVADNGTGIPGVNWRAPVFPIRWRSSQDGCARVHGARSEWIRVAAELGGKVVNMSYGFPIDRAECDAIRTLWQRGVMFVAALPNPGEDVGDAEFPARCPHVLSVTGHRRDGTQYGAPTAAADVSAPSAGVWTLRPSNGEAALNGTSLGVPQVSGLAQLMLAMGIPTQQIFNAVKSSATQRAWCTGTCGGSLHAQRAIQSGILNGTFEIGAAAPTDKWAINTGLHQTPPCSYSDDTANNVTRGGTRAIRLACVANGYLDLYQTRNVTGGWVYRVYVAARHTGADADTLKMKVCFYAAPPAPGGKAISCSIQHYGSEYGVGATAMTGVGFGVVAPLQARYARVVFRSSSSAVGTYTFLDDAAFYAFREID